MPYTINSSPDTLTYWDWICSSFLLYKEKKGKKLFLTFQFIAYALMWWTHFYIIVGWMLYENTPNRNRKKGFSGFYFPTSVKICIFLPFFCAALNKHGKETEDQSPWANSDETFINKWWLLFGYNAAAKPGCERFHDEFCNKFENSWNLLINRPGAWLQLIITTLQNSISPSHDFHF